MIRFNSWDINKIAKLQKFIKRYLKSKLVRSKQLPPANLVIINKIQEGAKADEGFFSTHDKSLNSSNHITSSARSKMPLIQKDKKHSMIIIKSSLRENTLSNGIISFPVFRDGRSVSFLKVENKHHTSSDENECNRSKIKKKAKCKSWEDGSYFIGLINDNMANGYGIFVHSSGDIYKGEFLNDKSCGYGNYQNIKQNSECYGEWYDDLQNGYGVELWKDKSSYMGQFKNGKQQGYGVYKWPNGSEYQGQWLDGYFSGYGIYTFSSTRKYMGEFRNNKMHGYGEFYWDTHLYIGYFISEKKDGFGIYYWFNPIKVYIGMWKQGQQHGLGKVMTEKSSSFSNWSEGKKTELIKDPKCNLNDLKNKSIAKLMNMSLIELKNHLFI